MSAGLSKGASADLGKTAARGVVITVCGQGARMVLQLASVVLLARLLDQRAFGLVAMALVVAGIGEIFRDFGLSSAAVQAKELSAQQRTNLFWLNTALGAASATAMAAAAPLIASAFHEPSVTPVARWLSLTFLINGIATQYRANLNRSMRFGTLAAVDVGAQAVSLAVGVGHALVSHSHWALVTQQLTMSATICLGLILLGRWLPGRPRRDPGTRALVGFGRNLVLAQLINYVTNNADRVVIGRALGAAPLGEYDRAFKVLLQPLSQVHTPITTVAVPVLSRLSDQPQRYARFLVTGQVGLGYTLVPALAVFAAVADPLILIALGPQWSSVAGLCRILTVAGACSTLSFVAYWVFVSRALTAQLVRWTTGVGILRVVLILIGARWGLTGVALAFSAMPMLSAPGSLFWLGTLTSLPRRELILGYWRILMLGVATAGIGYLAVQATGDNPWVQLAAGAGAALATYAGLLLLPGPLGSDRRALLEFLTMFRGRRPAGAAS